MGKCISSWGASILLRSTAADFSAEIIVVDDASPDSSEIWRLEAIPWIRYHRRPQNAGFGETCNEGAKLARGRYLVLLNSDVRVAEDWLDELIGSFELFPKAGLVRIEASQRGRQPSGGRRHLLAGRLRLELRSRPELQPPRYSFARQVDYASGAAIALPIQIWRELDGFDPAYRPAYCEDADLALRLRERGHEVWYQPMARVIHYEGKTHGVDVTKGGKVHQVANMKRLYERWHGAFAAARPNGQEPDKEANRPIKARMLVFDAKHSPPTRIAGLSSPKR